MTETTPRELAARLRRGDSVSVLDLRDRDAVERWGIEGRTVRVEQVPHVRFVASHATDDVRDPLPELPEPILVVCARGEASKQVAGWLREAGIDVRNLTGGTTAWAELVTAESLPAEQAVVRQYHRPATGCLSYLVAHDGEGFVIDPLEAHVDRYFDDADSLGVELRWVADTHVHADHLSGRQALADRADARAVVPAGCVERGMPVEDATLVGDGDSLAVGDRAVRVIATPGHTRESVALLAAGHLFAGDTIFPRSVGRPDLVGEDGPTALAGELYETIHDRLAGVSDDIVLAAGHTADVGDAHEGRYAAPLSVPRETELFELDRAGFIERVTTTLPPTPDNYGRILAANLGQTEPDEQAAFELELGPNHCAVAND